MATGSGLSSPVRLEHPSHDREVRRAVGTLHLLFVLGVAAPSYATAQASGRCLDNPSAAATGALCTQLVAAARLRSRAQHPTGEAVRGSASPVGNGALIGLGIGLGLGVLGALVVAPGCEENSGQCSVTFIVGGAALGAGIGALIAAAGNGD